MKLAWPEIHNLPSLKCGNMVCTVSSAASGSAPSAAVLPGSWPLAEGAVITTAIQKARTAHILPQIIAVRMFFLPFNRQGTSCSIRIYFPHRLSGKRILLKALRAQSVHGNTRSLPPANPEVSHARVTTRLQTRMVASGDHLRAPECLISYRGRV